MGVKNDITIIRLILGHWAGKLSEPEKKELDNWLAQSEKHRIYFQKWCDDERQNELLSKIGCYDPGEGWQQAPRPPSPPWTGLPWFSSALFCPQS